MTADVVRALEQEGIQEDPLEIAATYDGHEMKDWRLLDSHNGFSVFVLAPPVCGILLCYDHASLERECVVVSPAGVELVRVAGRRVRAFHSDFGFTPTLTNKIDRFIDTAIEAVDHVTGEAH